MMVQAHEEMGEETKPRKPKRKDTEIPQSSGPIEPIADEAVNKENIPTYFNDLLLNGDDSLKLNDLMQICTKLQQRVLDLENTKAAQAQEISSLKLRVKRLEKKGGSRTHKLKSLQEVTLVDETQGRNDEEMFDTGILDGEKVFVEQEVVEKEVSVVDPVTTAGEVVTTASVEVSNVEVAIDSATTTTVDELTLAQTLIKIKATKPKVKGVMIQEPSEFTTTTTTPTASKPL
ncbi:hypothetical protein Tco_0238133 [Tanacetum coccineum]